MSPEALRWSLAFLTLVLGVWMAARSAILRRGGVNVAALAERDGNRVQRALLVGAAALDIYILARAPFPGIDRWVSAGPSPAPWLASAAALLGAGVIVAAQLGMGRSWRIGIPREEGHVDALVTDGMHRISRNPVYLGVLVFVVAVAIAAPGPLTVAAIFISFAGLTLIIREEEQYLEDRFGDEFQRYRRRVRRWI